MRGITSHFPRKGRRVVVMDETKLKIQGRHVFVWAAMDADTKELFAVYASYYRSHINTLVFLRRVLDTCTNKPVILVDGGPWCRWPPERYGLRWLHVSLGERKVTIVRVSSPILTMTCAFAAS